MPAEPPNSASESSSALVPVSPEPSTAAAPASFASGVPQLPLGLKKSQLILAFAIAGVSDAISAFATFVPPVEWGVDIVTAILLFMVLGWRWLLLPPLILEAIPGVGALPLWVLVVGAIAVFGNTRPKLN